MYLTNEKKLAPSSILTAVAALRFLYKVTLKKDWRFNDIIPAPKRPQTLPVVLSPEEVVQFLGTVASRKHRVILTTCYAAGLRISEAVRLTLPAIDSARMVVRVEQGKGQKDRYVMLSPKLLDILRAWWRVERPRHWLFPGDRPRAAHQQGRGGARVPARAPPVRHPETDHPPFAPACLRCALARVRHRRPHHSTASWASQLGDHRPLFADRHQQGVLHLEPPRLAPARGRDGGQSHHGPRVLTAGPMERPKLEVADVFRRYGDAYRAQQDGSLSTAQRRVMTAIEDCRTAAVGGHVEQCDHCDHRRICYNSCRNRHCPKWT